MPINGKRGLDVASPATHEVSSHWVDKEKAGREIWSEPSLYKGKGTCPKPDTSDWQRPGRNAWKLAPCGDPFLGQSTMAAGAGASQPGAFLPTSGELTTRPSFGTCFPHITLGISYFLCRVLGGPLESSRPTRSFSHKE